MIPEVAKQADAPEATKAEIEVAQRSAAQFRAINQASDEGDRDPLNTPHGIGS